MGSDPIPVEDVDRWIRSQQQAGRSEVRLLSPSAPAALFRMTFDQFVREFGQPGPTREVDFAVWDFDYYQLSLRLDPHGVVLALDRG